MDRWWSWWSNRFTSESLWLFFSHINILTCLLQNMNQILSFRWTLWWLLNICLVHQILLWIPIPWANSSLLSWCCLCLCFLCFIIIHWWQYRSWSLNVHFHLIIWSIWKLWSVCIHWAVIYWIQLLKLLSWFKGISSLIEILFLFYFLFYYLFVVALIILTYYIFVFWTYSFFKNRL